MSDAIMPDSTADAQDLEEDVFPYPPGGGRYIPFPLGEDAEREIREEMRRARIDITPDTETHAAEAYELRDFLRRHRIVPHRRVAATQDSRGMVKLTFDEFRKLVNNVDQGTWVDRGWHETDEGL
jgi:hypothetical protein